MDPAMHECGDEAAQLLPWFVTGRLDAEDRVRVEVHLAQCPACRAELAAETSVHRAVRSGARVDYAPEPSFQKLMHRIDELDRTLPTAESGRASGSTPVRAQPTVSRWLAAALVLQTVGLALLGSLLWNRAESPALPAAYRTLASAPTTNSSLPQIRVVFAPGTTVDDVADVLRGIDGSIIAGPSEAGAYALAVASRPVETVLAQLRGDARIVFAEPIVGAPPVRR